MNDHHPLPSRYQEVLDALIADYIASASPVGSRTLSKRLSLRLSPATIRNVMSDLTDMGFLSQPHTSSGRIPTENGLRYYAESLLHVRDLSSEEQTLIRERCGDGHEGIGQYLRKTSAVLSTISHYVGLVMTPGGGDIHFRHIEFLPLSRGKLLGIFVATNGIVQNRVLEVDGEYTFSDLEKINNFCNRAFSGLNLDEARRKVVLELESAQVEYDRLLTSALLFSEEVFQSVPQSDLMIAGEARLAGVPEFAEVGRLRELLEVLEEKQQLLKLLDRCREAEGVQIFVGSASTDIPSLPASVVTAPYRRDGRVVGMLGVIGPKRMNYSHVIPIVDFTSKLVSDFLGEVER